MSTWVPSLPLGPGGFPIPGPGLGLLGPLIGGAVPVVANVLGAAIVSELLFPQTVADGTLDGNWRQVYRDWGTENFTPAPAPEAVRIYSDWSEAIIRGQMPSSGGLVMTANGTGGTAKHDTTGDIKPVVPQGPWTYSYPSTDYAPVWVITLSTKNGQRAAVSSTFPNGSTGLSVQRFLYIYGNTQYSFDQLNPPIFTVEPAAGNNAPTREWANDFAPVDGSVGEFVRPGERDVSQFRNPGAGLDGAVIGTGAPTLADLRSDAIAGAGIAVAAPPSPQLPGSSPVGVPGGGGSSSPEGQQVTGTGVAGGSAPLAPAPLAPAPLPAPVLPGPAPLAPSTAPALPGTPTEAPPAGAPALPGSQPLDNTGNPVPPTLAPPAVTPPGQETTPLGPVGGPAQQPAPTLQGIAAEVGKIEQKVLQLQRELQSPPGTGQLVPPWALPLLEALFSLGDGTTYAIPQPCGVDAQGNPEPPVEINVPGDINQLLVIKNRIDGLAELIAVSKEIKQPVCKAPAIQGQGVTVTFEQTPGG